MRYADDGVLLCRSQADARAGLALVEDVLGGLGLQLHSDKTRVVDLREGREGLDFLGCHLRARMSGRLWEQKRIVRYYLHHWPNARAMKRLREKIRGRTGRNRVGVGDIRMIIAELNPILRGWGNYFRTANAAEKFIQIDRYVTWRLRRLLVKKRGRNLACRTGRSMDSSLVSGARPAPTDGHDPLPEGSVTMSRRSSVSRVRENRTHGLKGGWGNRTATRFLRP